jgi:hypothetical protein
MGHIPKYSWCGPNLEVVVQVGNHCSVLTKIGLYTDVSDPRVL